MFIELVESNRKGKRSLGGTLVSVTLHTALISFAIAATANARTERPKPDVIPGVVYVPQQRSPKSARQNKPVQRSQHSPAPVPKITAPTLIAPIAVATGIPEITPLATPAVDPGSIGSGVVAATTGPDSGLPSGDGPLTQFQVDREVRAFPSNRPPTYPDALRARGVQGEVYARFVVDASGRVDAKSIEILSASSPAFANAVRYSLEKARFQPAEAAGKKVAQLVEQRFQFRLDGPVW